MRAILAMTALLGAGAAHAAGPFTLTSTSFRDGDVLAVKHAGTSPATRIASVGTCPRSSAGPTCPRARRASPC